MYWVTISNKKNDSTLYISLVSNHLYWKITTFIKYFQKNNTFFFLVLFYTIIYIHIQMIQNKIKQLNTLINTIDIIIYLKYDFYTYF